jgi:hypothetical protein
MAVAQVAGELDAVPVRQRHVDGDHVRSFEADRSHPGSHRAGLGDQLDVELLRDESGQPVPGQCVAIHDDNSNRHAMSLS